MEIKIFVTVGTSKFNELIQRVDEIIIENKNLHVIGQIGFSDFKPKNFAKFFRFTTNMRRYYMWADIVISHGGAGTIFDILTYHKKAIVFSNHSLLTEHQDEIIDAFEKLGYIIKGNMGALNTQINSIQNFNPSPYIPPKNRIGKIINRFIKYMRVT